MIVPMKKVYIITQGKDAYRTVDSLSQAGVVHVEHAQLPQGKDLELLKYKVNILVSAVSVLKSQDPGIEHKPLSLSEDWQEEAENIVTLSDRIYDLEETILKRQGMIRNWQPWGSFEPRDLKALEARGFHVKLFEGQEPDIHNIPSSATVEIIARQGKQLKFIVISSEEINLPLTSIVLPEKSLQNMQRDQQDDQDIIDKAKAEIAQAGCYRAAFEELLKQNRFELKFQETIAGMGTEESIVYLKGFCPAENVDILENLAKKEKWVVQAENPALDDRVPTLVRNPQWVEIIKPVFGVINVFPGYKEVDISLIFLIFFSIFFGILIGDAGYGLILIAITAFVQYKMRDKVANQAPFILLYVLSSCAVIWGGLTGTFLGTLLFGENFKPLVPWLTDNKNVQMICFTLGAIHLTIAHSWRILMKLPAVFAVLAELGWIIILWGAFFLANVMVVGTPLLGLDMNRSLLVVGTGAALVLADILSRPKDGIFIGLVLSFFSSISAFTDVVSYIRLFAVGMASVAVADAFNQMALGIGFNGLFAGLISTLILVMGHLFNIVLCGFGILVHGLRLNVLEFSGHLGLEWAGFKYDPLKKNI